MGNLSEQNSNNDLLEGSPRIKTKQGKKLTIIGDYQIGEIIGHGACGKVFKGLHRNSGNLVAIK